MDDNRSPLESLLTLGPRLALAAARTIQQATFDVVGPGLSAAYTQAEPVLRRALERAVDLLPVEAIIARVDVDAIVRQVDIAELISRIDLPTMISQVLSEIELGDLISDSTTSLASDARDSVRVQAMNVDGLVARIVDKILVRKHERDLGLPGFALGTGP
jgi:sugar-specific transcriptional regulator TrmB